MWGDLKAGFSNLSEADLDYILKLINLKLKLVYMLETVTVMLGLPKLQEKTKKYVYIYMIWYDTLQE